jgi:signal transduction histidine kinase
MLMNLMLNGIEAMQDKSGELTIVSKRAENGHLLISVSDTGVGLSNGESERVFEAFFTTKPRGTGMGLSVNRRIVALMAAICGQAPTLDEAPPFSSRCPWSRQRTHL